MPGGEQTVDQRKASTDTTPRPRRVSALGGSSSPIIVEGTDSAAELPWREAIAPLRGDRDETGKAMTEASERPAGTTRQRLIAAASHQFAHRSYSMVSLDDILAEAELTKGAMYFHFPSKQALALAIIDDLNEMSRAAVTELLTRKMSGLETLIDLVYLQAVQDTQNEVARAGVRLLETVDNTTALSTTLWQSWIEFVTTLIQKAVTEGDVSRPHRSRRHRQNAGGAVGGYPPNQRSRPTSSTTSITCKKHGYWHYPASPILTESTTSPNSSNDATHSP